MNINDDSSLTTQTSKCLIDTERNLNETFNRKPKTMLDILNDTIVKTLSETTSSVLPTVRTDILPNFRIKMNGDFSDLVVKTEIFPSVVKIEPSLRQTSFSMSSLIQDQNSTVKTEPGTFDRKDIILLNLFI